MKWLPNSIRWRIQLWHGLLLLAVLTGFGITAYHLKHENELRLIDGMLRTRLQLLHVQLTRGDAGQGSGRPPRREQEEDAALLGELFGIPMAPQQDGPPPGPRLSATPEVAEAFSDGETPCYFRVWFRDGSIIDSSPNAPQDLTLPARGGVTEFRQRMGFREAYEFTPPGECLLVGVSDAAVQSAMRRFTGRIVGYGSVVLLLGLLVGWWTASGAIAPIRAISATAQRIAHGDLQQRIPVAETESELGQLTTLLNDTFARLAASFDEQRRFTSDAAHELRTPVAVILAQTQLALSGQRSAEAQLKTIEMAHRNAGRMRDLIESLLTLAKADAGAEMERETVRVDELGQENLDHVRPLAEERQITLRGELPPTTCRAHAGHITQVLSNLLSNAVKYCRPGDEVRLSAQRQNGSVILTVADTGPGIPAEHLPHLFDRFYRADASRNRATGGAGLGLAICKTLVEAHGGSITAANGVSGGAVFQVTLPAA